MLNFQQELRHRYKRDNLMSLLGVKDIPCSEQIQTLVDDLEPDEFYPVFYDRNIRVAIQTIHQIHGCVLIRRFYTSVNGIVADDNGIGGRGVMHNAPTPHIA
jgi:hypothetical protein